MSDCTMSTKDSMSEDYHKWLLQQSADQDYWGDCILGQDNTQQVPEINGIPNEATWVELTDESRLKKLREVNMMVEVDEDSKIYQLHKLNTSTTATATTAATANTTPVKRSSNVTNCNDVVNNMCGTCAKPSTEQKGLRSDQDIYDFAMGGQNILVETRVSYLNLNTLVRYTTKH